MRWVSYTRKTSCIEEDSPPDIIGWQNKIIDDFMKANGWTVIKKYSDRRDDEDENGAFEQLVQDAMQRKFDGIIVGSLFRCGRNLPDARGFLMETCFPAGIHFAVAEDEFCSIGKTEEEIKDYFKKAQYKHWCSRMYERKKREKILYGLIQFGYVFSEDQCFLIDEEEAGAVRLIFRRFLEGKTYSEIAIEMNEKGVPTPDKEPSKANSKQKEDISSKWTGRIVKRILKSKTYTGKTSSQFYGAELEIDVPAIITNEMFEAAQKRIGSYKNHGHSTIQKSGQFRNRIYDKKTGRPMRSREDPMAPGQYEYYLPSVKSGKYAKKVHSLLVPESKVTDAITHRLNEVEKSVRFIDHILGTEESRHQEEMEIDPYRSRARKIVGEMNLLCVERLKTHEDHQDGKITEEDFSEKESAYQDQFQIFEDEFQKIESEVKVIEKAFSDVNPWLVYYRDMSVPSKIDRDFTRRWTDRILVDEDGKIEVVLKKEDWMNRLPGTWTKDKVEEL